jgi:hypothetical protein
VPLAVTVWFMHNWDPAHILADLYELYSVSIMKNGWIK